MFAALLIFGALVLAGYAGSTLLGARDEKRQALARRIASMTGISAKAGGVLKDQRLSAISFLNARLTRLGFIAPMAGLVVRAGLKKRGGGVLLYVPLPACARSLIVTLPTGQALLGVAAGAVGAMLPLLVLRRMARSRQKRFAD